ncbi:MAG: NADH-quinone oxidoreductase subunit L [Nannocystaceae bacterium]
MSAPTPFHWGLIALLFPLVAAALIGLVAPLRRAGMPAALVSIAAALTSLLASAVLLAGQIDDPSRAVVEVVGWLPVAGSTMAEVGLRLDGISLSMLLIVTVVATCVQVFSLGYMADEPPSAFGRYYGFHSLFIFSMNLLVLAPNLLQAFAGWELVGLTSYLLIGFYYRKPSAAKAAVKAFWVTKFGDMGLLLALVFLFAQTGAFSWDVTLSGGWAVVITALVFFAVVGKSAQFPLHVWLPNAMEGPTPVSALLHAATMVAAGVFLVVRLDPLFVQAPETQMAMAWIGAFTALFAAVIAVVQKDIKRVLAYSTCSQLGYMICALGAGSVMAAYFHLTTHAFFKALLFLGAGSVIHAVHSNNLADMGGLWRKMRLTAVTFIIGALALAGVPGLAGFFSKDLVLEAVHERGLWLPWLALLAAAFLTAFYMGRVVFLAFFGTPSKAAEHAHESGPTMALPLVVLAVGSVGAGYFGSSFAELYGASYSFHMGLSGIVATSLGLAGLGLAWLVYGRRSLPESSFAFLAPIGKLAESALLDRMYTFMFRRVLLVLAGLIGWLDRYVVDGLINVIGWAAIEGGRRLRRVQTGNVQDYTYAVVVGTILFVIWGLWP